MRPDRLYIEDIVSAADDIATFLVSFRNIAVHAYFGVDWKIVWTTAIANVPRLRGQAAAILHALSPP